MKNTLLIPVLLLILAGCNQRKVPDVSNIEVQLQLGRFEKDFFAIDTAHTDQSLEQLNKKYPGFLQDFVYNVLALPPQPDSSAAVIQKINLFIQTYQSLKDSADKVFGSMEDVHKEVTKGLQFVRYYFPRYKLPSKLITFVGPIDSYGNILTTDALGVGLQMYMGNTYSLYKNPTVQELYPAYISRRFQKEYIASNCMKNIIDDMYPDNTTGKPLVEQMIQAGKRLYLLDQLLPTTADSVKIGYTNKQLKGCYANESAIWSFFVQNDLLYVNDPSVTRDYMNDAPKTEAFGAESPGSLGQFAGWQIVKKWMEKHEGVSMDELMKTPAKKLFEEAKYKP